MSTPGEDPLVRSARREALVVTVITVVAMVYTIAYCSVFAYGRDVTEIEVILGFPDWVFWGVLVPWTICSGISIAFAFVFMRDDPLGEAAEDWNPDGVEPIASEDSSRHA